MLPQARHILISPAECQPAGTPGESDASSRIVKRLFVKLHLCWRALVKTRHVPAEDVGLPIGHAEGLIPHPDRHHALGVLDRLG